MTEEEKKAFFERRKQAIKAYFSKQKQDNEKQFLDLCRIKTQDQFVKECRKEDIPESWYAFTADRSKPVSMDEDTVYYGKMGKTIVSYPFQRWDIAYNELLKYKKDQALAQSGEQYRIDDIQWIADRNVFSQGDDGHFGTEYISDYDRRWTNEQDMAAQGWVFDHYDQYMAKTVYRRSSGQRRNVNTELVVEFTKLTDARDRKEFGFTETAMRGSYRYPMPHDLECRIVAAMHKDGELSESMKTVLKLRFGKTLLEDEFNQLIQLREEHRQALLDAIDSNLSEKEQIKAFANASNDVEKNNPAFDNVYGSRSYVVTDRNFDLAYEKAGIHRM